MARPMAEGRPISHEEVPKISSEQKCIEMFTKIADGAEQFDKTWDPDDCDYLTHQLKSEESESEEGSVE